MQLVQDEMKQFNLKIEPCPPGHVLHVTDSEDEYECRCNDNDVNIVKCAPNENKITLEVGSHYTYAVATTIHDHRMDFGLIMWTMVQWIAYWSITIVHLVTVNADV